MWAEELHVSRAATLSLLLMPSTQHPFAIMENDGFPQPSRSFPLLQATDR